MFGELLVWLGVAAVVLTAWTLYVSAPHPDDEEPGEPQRYDE
jgi:hypothetical protein